jgi:hypothetical protein
VSGLSGERISGTATAGAPAAAVTSAPAAAAVQRLNGIDRIGVALLLARYRLKLTLIASARAIPGSYWGDSEAGLKGEELYARLDTPVHSVLHEAGHYICMSPERRTGLDRDAGGDELEEAAVCYLQVLLADTLPGVGRARAFADMDAWGYSFRLGSTGAWFGRDAADARLWLEQHGLIDAAGRLTGSLRER